MSVKRYDLVGDMDGNCNLNEARMELSDDGVYVKYSEHLLLEQKLTDMAVQLANAESKCRELATENAGLKNPDNWLSQSDYGYEAAEVATQNGATEDESLRAGMLAIINRIETPATDAFLAEVRASGADEVSATCRGLANKDGCSVNMRCSYNLTAERAEAVSAQLRKGAAL